MVIAVITAPTTQEGPDMSFSRSVLRVSTVASSPAVERADVCDAQQTAHVQRSRPTHCDGGAARKARAGGEALHLFEHRFSRGAG